MPALIIEPEDLRHLDNASLVVIYHELSDEFSTWIERGPYSPKKTPLVRIRLLLHVINELERRWSNGPANPNQAP